MNEHYLKGLSYSYIKGEYNLSIILDMLAQEGYCPNLAHDGDNWFFILGGIEISKNMLQQTISRAIKVGIEEYIKR